MNMQTITQPKFRITAVLVVVAIVALICFELKRRNTRLVLTGVDAVVEHSNEGFAEGNWTLGVPSVGSYFLDCDTPDYLTGIGYPISIEIDGQAVGQNVIHEIEANESLERLVITNSSIDGVLDLNRFGNLEHLSFAGSSVKNVTFPQGGARLRTLSAAGTEVSDDDMRFLLNCTTLQAVDFSGTKVSPHFLSCLKDRCDNLLLLKGIDGKLME